MTLGSHAACSEQMPVCEDNHSPPTQKLTVLEPVSRQQRNESRTQTEPAGAQGEVREVGGGEPGKAYHKAIRLAVVLGMESHRQGQAFHLIPGSPAIRGFPCLPRQRPVAPQWDGGGKPGAQPSWTARLAPKTHSLTPCSAGTTGTPCPRLLGPWDQKKA